MARVVGFEGGQSGITPGTNEGPVNEVGVWGDSDTGLGVFGSSNSTYGVVGHREGPGLGAGVLGFSDRVLGVMGFTRSFPAVYGQSGYIDRNGEEVGGIGTVGQSSGTGGVGVRGSGGLIGTYGLAVNSEDHTAQIAGVVGEVLGIGAHNSPGVFGQSSRGPGVLGSSMGGPADPGVRGDSVNAAGVFGSSTNNPGVLGLGSIGVQGLALGGGRAGDFLGDFRVGGDKIEFYGDVSVNGTLLKPGGGFRIDHPQNPANKYLTHSFVESEDRKNVYDGVAILDESGAASVELPSWFKELNGDYRYQLTPIGAAAPDLHIAKEVSENSFEIAGGHPGLKVCWQVTGIRQDPWANANRIEVEEDKAEGERGYYLHPDLYDQPEEQGIGFAAVPEEVRQIKQQLEEGQLPELPRVLDDPRLEEQRQQMEELRRQFPLPSQRTESSEE